MKERPTLMTPDNAQKCYEGTKTQTRRILGSQPWEGMGRIDGPAFYNPTKVNKKTGEQYPGDEVFGVYDADGEWGCVSTFGRPGDRLWVREAWCVGKPALPSGCGIVPYYGPSKAIDRSVCTKVVHRGAWTGDDQPKWRSGMFMPRWACRTVLEITDVRVERLQDINLEDCQSEGVRCESYTGAPYCTWCSGHEAPCHRDAYKTLWESINGVGSWAQNPWVWVIAFKKL